MPMRIKKSSITLVQYQSGSFGHNLQKANKIIFSDYQIEYLSLNKVEKEHIGLDKRDRVFIIIC